MNVFSLSLQPQGAPRPGLGVGDTATRHRRKLLSRTQTGSDNTGRGRDSDRDWGLPSSVRWPLLTTWLILPGPHQFGDSTEPQTQDFSGSPEAPPVCTVR